MYQTIWSSICSLKKSSSTVLAFSFRAHPLRWGSLALIRLPCWWEPTLIACGLPWACWDLPLALLSLPCSRAPAGGISEHMATHVLLQLIPGCVCHRAVHRDRADGSNSDDGGHRWGRPCVPGTGSGMVARERLSPTGSTLGSVCPSAVKGERVGRWWVGREPIVRPSCLTGRVLLLLLLARGCALTCQEESWRGTMGLRLQAAIG